MTNTTITTTATTLAVAAEASYAAAQQTARITDVKSVEGVETVEVSGAGSEAEGVKLQLQREAAAYGRITALFDRRQVWQDTVYKTSNEMLYAILQDCYRLYNDMLGAGVAASAVRDALARKLSERKIKFDKNTHTMTKIVRCVFDGDRKRISAYSLALRAALANKVDVDNLAAYIFEQGGVEEVRLAKATPSESTQDKIAAAVDMLRKRELAVLTTRELTAALDAAKVGEQHVLIATQRADGSLAVNCIVSAQSAVNAALAAYYGANKETIKSHAASKAQADTEAINEKTMRELVAEAASA